MSLRVTVLGSSGVYATVDRACSGYLVEFGGTKLWVDAGAGSWRNLMQHTDYQSLTGIFISHRHPDHVTDVFQAYHARYWGEPGRLPPIPLWAPAETIERIYSFYGDSTEAFDLHEVDAESAVEIEDARLTFTEMAHPPQTLGVRIERDGAVMAYSADTGDAADFDRLARDADYFLCEATLQDSDPLWEGHLRAAQAGQLAAKVNVRRLVLTHLPPGRDLDLSLSEAQANAGDVDAMLAHDGMRIEVGA
ncbi:MAG TPA: MBL fold metallo-hydrolase [Actinomycetota bacterium]|jgi:ribonuclease BN (tRNA processing enzyme)|nr:MBL fold metallo-hydrolase [Actinomycetota bacterium]